MDKVLKDGTVYKKAKFLRTTCKSCREELTKENINKGYYWCNIKCRKSWITKCNRRK